MADRRTANHCCSFTGGRIDVYKRQVQTRGFECTIAAASFARTGALLREHSARIVLDPSIILRVSEDLQASCSPHGHFRIEPMTSSMP